MPSLTPQKSKTLCDSVRKTQHPKRPYTLIKGLCLCTRQFSTYSVENCGVFVVVINNQWSLCVHVCVCVCVRVSKSELCSVTHQQLPKQNSAIELLDLLVNISKWVISEHSLQQIVWIHLFSADSVCNTVLQHVILQSSPSQAQQYKMASKYCSGHHSWEG